MNDSKKDLIKTIIYSAFAGMACVVIPPYIFGHTANDADHYALVPFISKGLENLMFIPTGILLLISGFLFGYYRSKEWFIVGLSAMGIFPLLTLLEVIFHPTSHNMLPFEIVGYGIISIPSIFGAFIGSRVK